MFQFIRVFLHYLVRLAMNQYSLYIVLAGSKGQKKGDKDPRNGPQCLCEIFFFFFSFLEYFSCSFTKRIAIILVLVFVLVTKIALTIARVAYVAQLNHKKIENRIPLQLSRQSSDAHHRLMPLP